MAASLSTCCARLAACVRALCGHARTLCKLCCSMPLRTALPVFARIIYIVYAALATFCFPEVRKMFNDEPTCDEWDGVVCRRMRMPVRFCVAKSTSITWEGSSSSTISSGLECMDGSLIGIVVPVASVLSIIALVAYSTLDASKRFSRSCRCCKGMATSFSNGVLAGLGFATLLVLVQSLWSYFLVATIVDYFNKHYLSIGSANGSDLKIEMKGNIGMIWTTGGFALLAALLTLFEACMIVHSRSHKEAPEAPRVEPPLPSATEELARARVQPAGAAEQATDEARPRSASEGRKSRGMFFSSSKRTKEAASTSTHETTPDNPFASTAANPFYAVNVSTRPTATSAAAPASAHAPFNNI